MLTLTEIGIALELVGFPLFAIEPLVTLFQKGWRGRAKETMRTRYAHIAPGEESTNREEQAYRQRYMWYTLSEVAGLVLIVLGFALQFLDA